MSHLLKSHPSWVCGLKRPFSMYGLPYSSHTLRGCVDWNCKETDASTERVVTPFVGVWIETWLICVKNNIVVSHPSWVCGLKPILSINLITCQLSHPSWVCGLKQIIGGYYESKNMSHPSWVCGLKPGRWRIHHQEECHTLRGCVDWNIKYGKFKKRAKCHTLRGCVDWNTWQHLRYCLILVTPFVGVWIETVPLSVREQPIMVTPFVGVWIETSVTATALLSRVVTPFVGVWIETYITKFESNIVRVTPFVGVWIETENRFYFLSPLEKVIFTKTCHWLSISYNDKKYDSGLL